MVFDPKLCTPTKIPTQLILAVMKCILQRKIREGLTVMGLCFYFHGLPVILRLPRLCLAVLPVIFLMSSVQGM